MNAAAIETFFATLRAANPQPASELEYSSVFELLAAVLLSAQATDAGVNKATRRLFALAPTLHPVVAGVLSVAVPLLLAALARDAPIPAPRSGPVPPSQRQADRLSRPDHMPAGL